QRGRDLTKGQIMFTITIGRKDRSVTAATPVAQSAKPKRVRGAWKADPISPKQIGTLARMFRQLDLVSDAGIVHIGGHVFRYDETAVRPHDGKPGVWVGMDQLTKGEAGELLDRLFSMPKPGFGEIETAQAEPVSAPKAD